MQSNSDGVSALPYEGNWSAAIGGAVNIVTFRCYVRPAICRFVALGATAIAPSSAGRNILDALALTSAFRPKTDFR
jgi:hypothetical protein